MAPEGSAPGAFSATSQSTLKAPAPSGRLSPTKVRILEMVARRRLTSSELARELELDRGGVHRHLDTLAARGYVERIETRRIWVYFVLTEKGRASLAKRR